jgi:hypothetical protein
MTLLRCPHLRSLRAVMLAIAGLLTAGPVAAETSSWTSTVEAPDAAVPKKAPAAAPKIQKGEPPKKVAPVAAPKQPAAATDSSTATKAPAPSGEDAAYEAFDQGKYLTALGARPQGSRQR